MALPANVLSATDYLVAMQRALRAAPADFPVLLIYGEKDPGRRAGFHKHFEEIFEQAHSTIIECAHHFPHNDDPEAVAETIPTWCHAVWWRDTGACRSSREV